MTKRKRKLAQQAEARQPCRTRGPEQLKASSCIVHPDEGYWNDPRDSILPLMRVWVCGVGGEEEGKRREGKGGREEKGKRMGKGGRRSKEKEKRIG